MNDVHQLCFLIPVHQNGQHSSSILVQCLPLYQPCCYRSVFEKDTIDSNMKGCKTRHAIVYNVTMKKEDSGANFNITKDSSVHITWFCRSRTNTWPGHCIYYISLHLTVTAHQPALFWLRNWNVGMRFHPSFQMMFRREDISQSSWRTIMRFKSMPLEDVAVILKFWFTIPSYRIVAWSLTMKLFSGEYHGTTIMKSWHWLR